MATIRKLTSKDAEAYVIFRNKSHEESDYVNGTTLESAKKTIETFEEDGDRFAFIAVSGKEIIGQLLLVRKSKDLLFIQLISVLEQEYGKGLAGQLIEKAKSAAKDAGVSRIELVVHKDNERAITFYKRSGFIFSKMKGKDNIVFALPVKRKKPSYSSW